MAPPDASSSQGRRQATAHAGDAVSTARHEFRLSLKQRRNALSPEEHAQATQGIVRHLLEWRGFRRARRIASYCSVKAEVATGNLNDWLLADRRELYLPCLPIHRLGRLQFRRITAASQWCLNGYGIAEPRPDRGSPLGNPAFLDLILVPLLGFDAAGNRLGMGAGFYDRTLAFRRHRHYWHRPLLAGLGFACQQIEAIPAAPWDIPLDVIVTERGIIRAS